MQPSAKTRIPDGACHNLCDDPTLYAHVQPFRHHISGCDIGSATRLSAVADRMCHPRKHQRIERKR